MDDQRCGICNTFNGSGVHQGCPNDRWHYVAGVGMVENKTPTQSTACGHPTSVHHPFVSRAAAAALFSKIRG